MRFDHHLHTAKHSPDSNMDPWELIHHARAIGLDGIVITEHDYQWEADELADLAARCTVAECSRRRGLGSGGAFPGLWITLARRSVPGHQTGRAVAAGASPPGRDCRCPPVPVGPTV